MCIRDSFGEGSAKPIVSATTYGVGGNAFAQAIADPVSTVHSNKPELLVVDGYNVIHCTPRYEKLVYDHSDDPYSSDVHDMARTALINDVAAFAQGRYEAVIVFDGAGNISSERPNLPARGVRIEFSPTGVSADTVVQKLCIEAREEGRACSVVSSDGTIQAVVMGKGVTRISSRMLVDEIKQIDNDVHEAEEAPQIKMTLGSRLSPDALALSLIHILVADARTTGGRDEVPTAPSRPPVFVAWCRGATQRGICPLCLSTNERACCSPLSCAFAWCSG